MLKYVQSDIDNGIIYINVGLYNILDSLDSNIVPDYTLKCNPEVILCFLRKNYNMYDVDGQKSLVNFNDSTIKVYKSNEDELMFVKI